MSDKFDYTPLIKLAQLGDVQSLNTLSQMVRGRLYAYVYRILLQDDVAQDVVQECLLEMSRLINNLEKINRFWPWLRGIAFNKICDYFAEQQRHNKAAMSKLVQHDPTNPRWKEDSSALADVVSRELKQTVFNAIQQLNPRQRTVLTMRCYEKMKYSEIAELMQCSEISARVLFYRAKRTLQKHLGRGGFGKEVLLLALVVFGKMTAPAEAVAEVSLTRAAVSVGLTTRLLAMVSNKAAAIALKTVTIAAVAAGGVTAGSKVPTTWVDNTVLWMEQIPSVVKKNWASIPSVPQDANKAGAECWYYYPLGSDGPVMMRLSGRDRQEKTCCQLQNEQANYYFDKSSNIIYINNRRMWNDDLAVWRLPTDKPQLINFLSKIEGKNQSMQFVSSDAQPLLLMVKADKQQGISCSQIISHHNVLDEEYFRYNWPAGASVTDNRDQMHRRGWTYFTVTGQIDGRKVSGTGRIPFVYATSTQYYPWLKLQVAEQTAIINSINGTCVYDAAGQLLATYSADNCFKALARPWMGLHAIDIIRRDAAQQAVPFQTLYTPGQSKAHVILTAQINNTSVKLDYVIDMDKDVIDKIIFSSSDRHGQAGGGELSFYYLEKIDNVGDQFAEPREEIFRGQKQQESGIIWLLKLAAGTPG